jgi:hypothetical protein
MNSRILLKDIPSGKFHSALLTTYSFNFYFFEQQVLRLLGSKGIHYVSVLVDGNILDTQFNTFSILSEVKKRNYAIHGIQSKGAFHPKINFFAGDNSILIIIGSGNLTSSGHGKNLEIWNCIYVENNDDEKMGLVRQCWSYLKNLHKNLGESAQQKLKVIEENCSLLSNLDKIPIQAAYAVNEDTFISFLASNTEGALIKQLTDLLVDDSIQKITIMSPYYDIKGDFIHQLNSIFKPTTINVILQKEFGTVPISMNPTSNVLFYDWEDVSEEKRKQKFFHAKNFIFEGEKRNYLLTGSANASIAAFGNQTIRSINHEACILYQEKGANYLGQLGISLDAEAVKLSYFNEEIYANDQENNHEEKIVFISAIEQNYGQIKIYFSIKNDLKDFLLCLYNSKGEIVHEEQIILLSTQGFISISIKINTVPLYGVITDLLKSVFLSNRQFVIDTNAFDATNPSPQNKSLSQLRNMIEGGNFYSIRIIDFLNTIYQGKKNQPVNANNASKLEIEDNISENKDNHDLLFLNYEEIQERSKDLEGSVKAKMYVDYKSVRLWESIFIYLKEIKQREEEIRIDEEETENIDKSSGKKENKIYKYEEIEAKQFENHRKKINVFFKHYINILDSKITDESDEKLSLIDISMYLIVIEILLHLFSHKENIKGVSEKKSLLTTSFYNKENDNWSKYIIQIIGKFLLWYSKKGGFENIENEQYKSKIQFYEVIAYKISICALVLLTCENKNKLGLEKKLRSIEITRWRNLALLNLEIFCLNSLISIDNEVLSEFIPIKSIEAMGIDNISSELKSINIFLSDFRNGKNEQIHRDYFKHHQDGYTYILKKIPETNEKFWRLEHIGYNWDEIERCFWEKKVYNIKNKKWLNALTK